jgi:hypothetical protein
MDPLELVRSRNRADIELPSGLGATIGLARVQDAMMAGVIPVPVLREYDRLAEAARSNGEVDVEKALDEVDPSPEMMAVGMDLRREMVRRTLKRLAPSLAELEGPEINMPAEVIEELSQEDFDVLAGYAMRDTPFPAASPST